MTDMSRTLASSLVVVVGLFIAGGARAQPGAPSEPQPQPPPDDGVAPDDMQPAPPPPPDQPMQPQPPPPPPPPAIMQPPAPPPTTVDQGMLEDANAGRNWLAPTALMDPAGTWSFSDFELFVVGASYAPTDRISLSAATLIPVSSDQPFVGLFSAKVQLLRAGRLRIAAQGAVTFVADSTDGFTAGVLGGAGTLCLDDLCRSHLTGYLAAGFARADQTSVPFLVSAAGVFRLGRRVKLVLEADSAFIAGDINETADGFLAWYGLRFTSAAIGIDVGLMKPIAPNNSWDDSGAFPAGFPFVSFTYRGLNE